MRGQLGRPQNMHFSAWYVAPHKKKKKLQRDQCAQQHFFHTVLGARRRMFRAYCKHIEAQANRDMVKWAVPKKMIRG